jgi:NADH-quinone oxidoreductase subunit G
VSEKVKITVNGEEHEVEGGGWLIDTLNELGCQIPHFCYHPGLGPDGNCRMCQVEFMSDRGGRLAISCNATVTDGLNIVTNSDRVKAARATVEEMLLLNHPLDCPICDKAGECTLQNYYMDHDMKNKRQTFTRFKKNKALDIGPTMVLDQERCVLCDRCVRFMREWAGEEQLYIAGRGHGAYLTPFPGKPVDNPYSLNTYDLCPVGALTSKDFRFSIPTWFLTRTPSTCTSCARGCSIEVDSRDQTIHRLRPRHNPQVNDYWMCDEGRLNYTFVNSDRIKRAFVDRGGDKIETSIENGLGEARKLLGLGITTEAVKLTILASATCTLEEMYMLKTLAAAHANATLAVARHMADGVEDDRLRKADRHPNARGADLLGIPMVDLRDGAKSDMAADAAALLAVGFDDGISADLQAYAAKFSCVVVITARDTALRNSAHVALPGLTFAEKDGLIVNFEGHVQLIAPALDNVWDRKSPWELIAELTAALTGEASFTSIKELRSSISSKEAPFSGVDLNAVGLTGVRLQAQTV